MTATWIRRALLLVVVLGIALSIGGCRRRARAVVVAGGGGGEAVFMIENRSYIPICYVNFSPTTDRYWGPDQLGASEVIHPGTDRGWRIVPNYYDYRLVDCNRNTVMERRNVAIPAGQQLTVTFRTPE